MDENIQLLAYSKVGLKYQHAVNNSDVMDIAVNHCALTVQLCGIKIHLIASRRQILLLIY